jgi:EAL domain-containing protein (putative c-di-GMP-specific phosphodiesterase class I)
MITLSHDLGYRVVAEGVETAACADILAKMQCDEAQGYFFARPLEADRFENWYTTSGAPRSRAAA